MAASTSAAPTIVNAYPRNCMAPTLSGAPFTLAAGVLGDAHALQARQTMEGR